MLSQPQKPDVVGLVWLHRVIRSVQKLAVLAKSLDTCVVSGPLRQKEHGRAIYAAGVDNAESLVD